MKKILLKLENTFELNVPDDYDFKADKENGFEDLYNIFADRITMNNETASILFWESLDVIGEIKNE